MFTEVVIETTATVVLISVFHDQLTMYIHITVYVQQVRAVRL